MSRCPESYRAFSSTTWRNLVDAFQAATGVTLRAFDPDTGRSFDAGPSARCGDGPLACASGLEDPVGVGWTRCEDGSPAFVVPVPNGGGTPDACVALCGFVTDAGQRAAVERSMLQRGAEPADAERIARDMPKLTRSRVESLGELVAAQSVAALDGGRCVDADGDGVRFEALLRAERRLVDAAGDTRLLPTFVVEAAVELVAAPRAALLLPDSAGLTVAATAGAHAAEAVDRDACRRAAASHRPVVISDGRGAVDVAVPVPWFEGSGVLWVSGADSGDVMGSGRLGLLEQFAAEVGHALRASSRKADRAAVRLAGLNEAARSLSGARGVEDVVSLAVSILEKSVDADIVGLALLPSAGDARRVAVRTAVRPDEVAELVSEVLGGVQALPLAVVEAGGTLSQDAAATSFHIETARLADGADVLGYMFIADAAATPCAEDMVALRDLAAHTAAAVSRSLHSESVRRELAKAISALSLTLDAAEACPPGHSDRVMEYATAIGEELGLDGEGVETLRFAGLLHDVGKLQVPKSILEKPGELTVEEMDAVRAHSEAGASIARQLDLLRTIAPVILHHHERWDGQGYPAQLSGDRIPLLSRILSVADAYEAMTMRTYREPMPHSQARNELITHAGTQFDPRVVDAFMRVLERRASIGSTGMLAEPHSRPERPS